MDRPTLTVGDIFRRDGEAYRHAAGRGRATAPRRVMSALASCRTAALGGHVEPCDHCGHTRVWYTSGRHRHGPTCQSLARAAWIEARMAALLDTEYFHGVFPVPQAIAEIAAQNTAVVSGILFRATADTLRTIAADPRHLGAAIGFCAVRHTWGQTVRHHPPLHGGVPGGGLSPEGTRWIACRPGFFLPVRVLSRLFRRLFLDAWQEAFDTGPLPFAGALHALADPSAFAAHLHPTRHTDWVVQATRPFAGPHQVLEYVGRSTHRVAIANQRRLDLDDGHVRFRDKNYRATPPQTPHTMTLDAPAFIRRVLLHVWPTGVHRIRDDGWLGHRHRTETLARCRQLLGTTTAPPIPGETVPPADSRDRSESLTGVSRRACPVCADGHRIVTQCLRRARRYPVLPDTS